MAYQEVDPFPEVPYQEAPYREVVDLLVDRKLDRMAVCHLVGEVVVSCLADPSFREADLSCPAVVRAIQVVGRGLGIEEAVRGMVVVDPYNKIHS